MISICINVTQISIQIFFYHFELKLKQKKMQVLRQPKRLKIDQVMDLLIDDEDDLFDNSYSDDEKQIKNSNQTKKHETSSSSDDDENIPISKLVSLRSKSLQNKTPLSNITFKVLNQNKKVDKIESDCSDDDIPISILIKKKTESLPIRKKSNHKSILNGIYDFDEVSDDENSISNISKVNNLNNSPILYFDNKVKKYILSMKNSKRKSVC